MTQHIFKGQRSRALDQELSLHGSIHSYLYKVHIFILGFDLSGRKLDRELGSPSFNKYSLVCLML